jgi:hypothetical protein
LQRDILADRVGPHWKLDASRQGRTIMVRLTTRFSVLLDGETVASSTVRDLVAGSGLPFRDRGLYELRGFPEKMHLYSVVTTT